MYLHPIYTRTLTTDASIIVNTEIPSDELPLQLEASNTSQGEFECALVFNAYRDLVFVIDITIRIIHRLLHFVLR